MNPTELRHIATVQMEVARNLRQTAAVFEALVRKGIGDCNAMEHAANMMRMDDSRLTILNGRIRAALVALGEYEAGSLQKALDGVLRPGEKAEYGGPCNNCGSLGDCDCRPTMSEAWPHPTEAR